MINFECIDGPFGVPVYFQQLPVNTVSLSWLVFTGSADDEQAGGHGIYHWFEHIPSRGTEKFPGGYFDTEARLVRPWWRRECRDGFYLHWFQCRHSQTRMDRRSGYPRDMVARPLLRLEDIEAEREVILHEIDEWHSAPYSHSLCRLPSILWPGHPLGHDQLGTADTLQAIDPSLLRQAHELGYSRNRCALFVAGDIERSQLLDYAGQCLERVPNRDIEARTRSATYGELPGWRAGETSQVNTNHEDSVVYLLFPLPSLAQGHQPLVEWDFLAHVFAAGELGSPLNRLVREDSQLAYSPDFTSNSHPDGGYAGLVAQTSVEPQRVVDAFWELIRSPEIRSRDWLAYVRDTIRGSIEMHDPDASDYVEEASAALVHYGTCLSDDEYSEPCWGSRTTRLFLGSMR